MLWKFNSANHSTQRIHRMHSLPQFFSNSTTSFSSYILIVQIWSFFVPILVLFILTFFFYIVINYQFCSSVPSPPPLQYFFIPWYKTTPEPKYYMQFSCKPSYTSIISDKVSDWLMLNFTIITFKLESLSAAWAAPTLKGQHKVYLHNSYRKGKKKKKERKNENILLPKAFVFQQTYKKVVFKFLMVIASLGSS